MLWKGSTEVTQCHQHTNENTSFVMWILCMHKFKKERERQCERERKEGQRNERYCPVLYVCYAQDLCPFGLHGKLDSQLRTQSDLPYV